MKKFLLQVAVVALCFLISPVVNAQRSIIAGETSAGVYTNIGVTGTSLNVANTGLAATFTSTAPTVTNGSTTILAANTVRKALMIQNNSTTGIVYLNFNAAATTADLQIAPGQSLYLSGIVPSGAVRAIGSIASNTAVVLVEAQ